MNHQVGQSISVRLGQLIDGLIQHGEAVVLILDGYKNRIQVISMPLWILVLKEIILWKPLCEDSPAASMKALLRWKVSSGSGRFLKKSLRAPATTLISSTLLSWGRVFPLISFSFSSFTKRSWPETLYRPTWDQQWKHLYAFDTTLQKEMTTTMTSLRRKDLKVTWQWQAYKDFDRTSHLV